MIKKHLHRSLFALVAPLVVIASVLATVPVSAACSTATYGTDTIPVSITSATSYYVWVRMQVPDSTNNGVDLSINTPASSCYSLTGSSPGSWVWIEANKTSPVALNAQGYSVELFGTKAGVAVDKILLLADANCVPATDGSNCTTSQADTVAPTVSLTAPANGTSVSGTQGLTATASDNVAVANVQFLVDGANLGAADTSSPYSASWDSTTATNGSHTLTAKATDTSGLTATSTVTVTVNNGGGTGGSTGTVQGFTWNASTKTLSWLGYTGATSYVIAQVHNPNLASSDPNYRTPTDYSWPHVTGTSCTMPTSCGFAAAPNAGETVKYGIVPLDSTGAHVAGSTWAQEITVTWPSSTDTTKPTTPTNLTATAASSSQINLTWTASTDSGGSGLAGYQVFRSTGSAGATQVATVTGNSFGDSGLTASTSYSYYVKAIDGAKLVSDASNTATATTQATQTVGISVNGHVRDSKTNTAVSGANVRTGSQAGVNGTGSVSATTDGNGYYNLPGIDANPKHRHNYYYVKTNYVSQTFYLAFPANVNTKDVNLVHR